MKSLGCNIPYPDDPSERHYVEAFNSALWRRVESTTGLFRVVTQQIHNTEFATPWATAAIVRELNLYLPHNDRDDYYSVAEPLPGEGGGGFRLFGYMSWSHPKERIRLPNGAVVAAGIIGYILGDEGRYANERMRDWAILEHLQLSPAEFIAAVESGKRRWLSDIMIDAIQQIPAQTGE